MADRDEYNASLVPPPPLKKHEFGDNIPGGVVLGSGDTLAALMKLQTDLGDRSTVKDSAVGLIDTLQSIGSLIKAPLPGETNTLQQSALNSRFLDEFRSPAYSAEREFEALTSNPDATVGEGIIEGIQNVLAGSNVTADVIAQSPYLFMGTAARALGFAAATKVPGVLGKGISALAGTGQGAVINRIGALSGILEGQGGYAQTYLRAADSGLSAAEATKQAKIAGLVSGIVGAVLGKTTPGFELSPTGKFAGNMGSHLTAIAGEVVEETGIAVSNTVTDNILAGKDPLQGLGQAVGEAGAIAAIFSGGIRSPRATFDSVKGIRDAARNIGKGVRSALGKRAVTPEQAAAAAATDILNEANAANVPNFVVPETEQAAPAGTVVDATPETEVNIPSTLELGREKSTDPNVETVLVNAQFDIAIGQTQDEAAREQLEHIQEEFKQGLPEAAEAIENLKPEVIAEAIESNDEQSALTIEAVRLTDVTKLPDTVLSEDEQAIKEEIVDLSNTQVDETARQIFEYGFIGLPIPIKSLGIRQYLQGILNWARLRGDTPNEYSSELARFVRHLDTRAQLFQLGLDLIETAKANGVRELVLTDTRTRDKEGILGEDPFILHVNSPTSIAVAQRAVADSARARKAFNNARKRFPNMFKSLLLKPSDTVQSAFGKTADSIRAQAANTSTPAAVAALAAPTPTPTPTTTAIVKNESQKDIFNFFSKLLNNERMTSKMEKRWADWWDSLNADEAEGSVNDYVNQGEFDGLTEEQWNTKWDVLWNKINTLADKVNPPLSEVPASPPASKTAGKSLDERLDAFIDEKNALPTDETGRLPKALRPLQNALQAAAGVSWSTEKAAEAIDWALENGRRDIAEAIVERAERIASKPAETPGVQQSNPKYQAIKEDLLKRREADRQMAVVLRQQLEGRPKAPAPATAIPTVKAEPSFDFTELIAEANKYADEETIGRLLEKDSDVYVKQQLEAIIAAGREAKTVAEEKLKKAAAKREAKDKKAREKRAAVEAAKQKAAADEAAAKLKAEAEQKAAAEKEAAAVEAVVDPVLVEETTNEPPASPEVPPVLDATEQAEARDAPPLSDEEMDSLEALYEETYPIPETETEAATETEIEADQATNPLVLAPLAENQEWVNPSILGKFTLDPLKSVSAMLAKLRASAPLDAAIFTEAYNNLRPIVDALFKKGIENKGLTKEKLADFISKPFGVFVQFLIRNKDGSLEVQKDLREALTYAAVLQLFRAPTQYDSFLERDKNGIPIKAARVDTWVRNIAHDMSVILGMKGNKNVSVGITQGSLLSLALSAVQALIQNGDIKFGESIVRDEETLEFKTYNVVEPTAEFVELWKKHPKLVDHVANVLGIPVTYTASLDPSTNIPERVKHSSTKTSDSQKIAIQNLNNVDHHVNPVMMTMLEVIDQDGFNRLVTGTVWRADMPEIVKDWIRAKTSGIVTEIRAANHYQKMLAEAVKSVLHFEYGITANGRTSSFMSPQGYTLLRDLFSSAKFTVKLDDQLQIGATELAIAQALGLKLKDETPIDLKTKYKKKVAELGSTAKSLVLAIRNAKDLVDEKNNATPDNPFDPMRLDSVRKEIMEFLERGTPLKPRELTGILTLGELLLAQETGATELVTYIPIEVDGVTSGAVNAELLFGLSPAEINRLNLEQGGAFLDTGPVSWSERLAWIIQNFNSIDLYTRVASTAFEFFNATRAKSSIKQYSLDEDIDALLIATDMLNADGTDFLREASKRASNPIVYGAGITGIVNQLLREMRANLIRKWINLDFQLRKETNSVEQAKIQIDMRKLEEWLRIDREGENPVWIEAAQFAARALKESYEFHKPTVTARTQLMTALTSFAHALRAMKFEEKEKLALKYVPENKDIPDTAKNKEGKTVRPRKWPASLDTYEAILRDLFSLRIGTLANPESVNLDNAGLDESGFRVEGLGTSFSAPLTIPYPANPGVSVLALTTIGAGDAAMMNAFMQEARQITSVWDGVEFIPVDVDTLSVELNKAAWEAANYDVLAHFVKIATRLRQHMQNLTEEEQHQMLAKWNEQKTKWKALQKQSFLDNTGGKYPNKSLLGAMIDLETKLKQAHTEQQEGLALLKSRQIYFIHMANGQGYVPPVTTRDATASPDMRAGWSDSIDNTFQLFGNKVGRTTAIQMLDGVKWNRIQAYVWKRLKPLLPAGLSITLARTAEEWKEATGRDDFGTTLGRTFIDGDRIVLATAAPSVVLHEVMHATLTKLISNFMINPASVPVGVRTAVNNLVQMLATFKTFQDPRLAVVQNSIMRLEGFGDTAAAIDEMMTYVLTDPTVAEALSPSFVTRLITRIKQVFWSFLGKEIPDSFLDGVLKSFTSLTNDIITENMGSYIATTTRDATSPLDALTLRAFKSLAQIVVRRPGMKIANIVNESMIDKIKTQYALSADQTNLFKRVFLLLRLTDRKGELEQFVSTAISKHPNVNLFNGAKDLTASVLALAAVDPTFAAQLEDIYRIEQKEPGYVDALVDVALNDNRHFRVEELLTETLSAVIEDGEYELANIGLITHKLDTLGQQGLELIGEKALQLANELPTGPDLLLKGVYSLLTEDGSEAFGRGLMNAVNTHTKSLALQSLVGALVGSQEDTNAVYRQLKRFKSVLAKTRSDFTVVLPKVLHSIFPPEFAGWNDLFEFFGRLDVPILGDEAATMFNNDDARKRTITALESKIENKWDAFNLAHYLVHGVLPTTTPYPLLKNARAIADNLNGTIVTAPPTLVADVDQLVTLYAIDLLTKEQRARMSRIFEGYPTQITRLSGLLQKITEEETKQLTNDHVYQHWKGSLPLTVDERHSIVISGPVNGARLEQLGYKRADKYKQSAGDPVKDMYYYVRPYAPPPVFSQGIIATVKQTALGVNYTTATTISPEVGTKITKLNLVAGITRNLGTAPKLIPVHNAQGLVIAYERMLDRDMVRKYTNSNNTLLHISIGQKLGRILEERWALRFNEEAIQIMFNQWEQGKLRGMEDQYEAINRSTNKQIVRAWKVVPADIKRKMEKLFDGPVMVRRDLIEQIIGYHDAGVGDIFTGDASLSQETRQALIGIAQTVLMGPRAAQILYAAESAIAEGVATARDWIIVRSVSVATNNALASLNLVVANGVPPKQIFQLYRRGLADIRVYNRLTVQSMELMVQIAGTQGDERKRLETLHKAKQAQMKRLSIYPLIELGELSDLPEGLIESPDNTYLGDFTGWLNKKLSFIHPKMPMVVANIAIAKDSEFHDTLSKAIMAGDFLGKYTIFMHMVNSGMGIEAAKNRVRDEFVAYQTNYGRARGYAEKMGMIHWSQFTIRAQKVLLNRLRQNPFSFFVSQMGSGLTGTDGPWELSVTERGLDNSTGLDQVFGAPSAHIYSKLIR